MIVTARSSTLLGVLALVLWSCALAGAHQPAKLTNFFHEYIGLNEDQIRAIGNGQAAAGLTELKGTIVRNVAVDKTRSSLQRAPQEIKQNSENQTGLSP